MSMDDAKSVQGMLAEKETAKPKGEKKKVSERLAQFHERHVDHTLRFTQHVEQLTGQESRLTILGHLQRGGTPRLLIACWRPGSGQVAQSCSGAFQSCRSNWSGKKPSNRR